MTWGQCGRCVHNMMPDRGLDPDGNCGVCDCDLIHHDTRVSNYRFGFEAFETDCPAFEAIP